MCPRYPVVTRQRTDDDTGGDASGPLVVERDDSHGGRVDPGQGESDEEAHRHRRREPAGDE
jgi:hypothetical protein